MRNFKLFIILSLEDILMLLDNSGRVVLKCDVWTRIISISWELLRNASP